MAKNVTKMSKRPKIAKPPQLIKHTQAVVQMWSNSHHSCFQLTNCEDWPGQKCFLIYLVDPGKAEVCLTHTAVNSFLNAVLSQKD